MVKVAHNNFVKTEKNLKLKNLKISDRFLYTGVTNNLVKRVYEHKNKLIKGFSSRYNLDKLVYYKICGDINSSIVREKQIKAGSRKKKLKLVEGFNSEFEDLYTSLV